MASTTIIDAEYKHWYNRGWRYSASPTATLDHGDALRVPDAWYDGYLDHAAGREKWHLPNCRGCPEHPDRAAKGGSHHPTTKQRAIAHG